MIPKIIHYCWFGNNPYPDIVKKCIKSWKDKCPDYEIIEWNESNYDVHIIPYTSEAYRKKKWAFVSDYARLDIIYHYGGIYLDTDVELIKPLNNLCNLACFLASDGCGINTGLGFGAEKENLYIKNMKDIYNGVHFTDTNEAMNLTPSTYYNTQPFTLKGFDVQLKIVQYIEQVVVFPPEYFSPKDGESFELNITENTYGIHWDSRLWETGMTRLKAKLRLKLGMDSTKKIKMTIKRIKNSINRIVKIVKERI